MYCVSLKMYNKGVKLDEHSRLGSIIQHITNYTRLKVVEYDDILLCNMRIFAGSHLNRCGSDFKRKVGNGKPKSANENRRIDDQKLEVVSTTRKVGNEKRQVGNEKRDKANEKRNLDSQKRLEVHAGRKMAYQKMKVGHQKIKVGNIKRKVGFEKRMEDHPGRWGNDQKRCEGFSELIGR